MTQLSKLTKAIIPAAGRGTRQYPASSAIRKELFPLVDRDGVSRATIQFVVMEALSSGVEQVCIVTAPGEEQAFRDYFQGLDPLQQAKNASKPWMLRESEALKEMGDRLVFRAQEEQLGLGHSIWCARDFAGVDPVLVLLGDHIYISQQEQSCATQAVSAWHAQGGNLSCVRAVSEENLHLFGIIRPASPDGPPWRVAEILEKPDVQTAMSRLQAPGLPDETPFLAFFGIHILQPGIFDCLDHLIHHDIRQKGEIQLTAAQSLLAQNEPYWAAKVDGETYDVGIPGGYAVTQAALTALGPYAAEAAQAAERVTKRCACV